jgi:SAM-dependent methyltransferase
VATWRNSSGHALSSPEWLEAHHRAKLPERIRFAQRLVKYRPRRVVDLGCATGLWLDLLDKALPPECELVGVDSDPQSLAIAKDRARTWSRQSEFVLCDITADARQIPASDLALAFNVFAYLPSVSRLLEQLDHDRKLGRLIIRQYDGATMRLGPMPNDDRFAIDASLQASLDASSEFSHYDMDRIYCAVANSALDIESIEFELTQRHTPFPVEFDEYFRGTVDWMLEHLSDDGRSRLARVMARSPTTQRGFYFTQVDIVAVLSTSRV